MRKKSYTARLGALALALTLVTTSLMGGTLAKYTTTVEASGSATVAKWAIKAGDKDGGEIISTFTLRETASGVAEGKIAPGTKGELPIYIDLTGTEVATEVKVTISVDDISKLPTNFVMKNSDNAPITFSGNGTEFEVYSVQKSAAEAASFNQKVNISWEWPFEINNGNESDTTDGKAAGKATFTVKVTATQLDKDPAATP